MTTRILITGGHLTPAIAVIEELKKLDTQILLVGREYTDISRATSKEEQVANELKIAFNAFDPAKLHRSPLTGNLNEIPKLIQSFIQANSIISSFKPEVILSFGGYVALPICLVAWIKRIPIVTHEQTTILGLTNKLLRTIAKITLAWEKTGYAPANAVLVGNPIRKEFLAKQPKPSWLKTSTSTLPVLYVTGGNQGSRSINKQIFNILPELVKNFIVIHQLGNTDNEADYNQALTLVSKLKLTDKYYPHIWLDSSQAAWCMQQAALVISRSGANSVCELLVSTTNSILIPLPTAASNEQMFNAQRLQQLGIAKILRQDKIDELLPTVMEGYKPPNNSAEQIKELQSLVQLHKNAAYTLATFTITCAKKETNDHIEP